MQASVTSSGREWERLEREARLFSHYLLGADPPREVVARYAAAHAFHFVEPAPADDRAVLDFAVRHPWALGPLDAACARRKPDSLLRKKLLMTAAILEASPYF